MYNTERACNVHIKWSMCSKEILHDIYIIYNYEYETWNGVSPVMCEHQPVIQMLWSLIAVGVNDLR